MSASILIPMSMFALASSLSPGPVNLVCISSAARFGVFVGLMFVTGSTLGFIALFGLIGLGLHHLITALPWFIPALQGAGVLFLLYLSYQLFKDDGEIADKHSHNAPTFWTGAIMQWVNPKAWLASFSGIATYATGSNGEDHALLLMFIVVYLPICWLSLSAWVMAGAVLGNWLSTPIRVRRLNKTLAIGLALSCLTILINVT
ncbi:LysE family translocator [Marinomonas balearica]|uniref:Threonine/homoserine/homoserine lactone efflux protein n=1 Tax=Marinomonas balearica TaxID=491947 RepID=A0A4R6MJL6_9GAMM|nr:LysE family translocator [Marinomonas balearica]TDP01847.1 threonine/homoserine/homoserine lactone efflux protein [Marinomonas balearica]